MAREMESKYVLTAEDRMRMAFESAQRRFQSLDRIAGRVGLTLGGAFSVVAITAWLGKVAEAEKSESRLTAVIAAQGHAAGFTRKQLEEMNEELVATSQFDDDAIREGQAQLLKFGNIYNDVFERALKASADLAAFQGTDLRAGIEAVGKALQNPALGMKQLEQQIGKLDPAQKEIIKNLVEQNRVVEAQNRLLDILHSKIGGAAQQLNQGYAKSLGDVAKSWDELLEAAGKAGPVQATAQSFLGFLNQSLKDMKSIIESGDWFAGVLFMLGGRGHISPNSEEGIEKRMESYRAQINSLNDLLGMSGVSDAVKGNARKQLEELETRLANEAETIRLMNRPTNKGGKPLNPKIEGDDSGKKLTTKSPLREHVQNILSLSEAYFEAQQRLQEFAQVDLEKQKEIVDREKELRILKADNAAFGRGLAQENRERTEQLISQGENYLAVIREETDLMTMNARQRMHLVDTFNLEAMGLKRGTAEWDDYVEKITAARDQQQRLNESWEFGAKRALRDYLDEVRNVADATSRLFDNAFRSMEDALVEFTVTGKLSFRDMAESILRDIARIQVQQSITGPLAAAAGGLLDGLFGGGTTTGGGAGAIWGGARADGGPVSSGRAYLVGERGPEIFLPRQSGSIVPNGAGGTTNHFTVDMRGASVDAVAELRRLVMQVNGSLESRAVAAVRSARQRGGRV